MSECVHMNRVKVRLCAQESRKSPSVCIGIAQKSECVEDVCVIRWMVCRKLGSGGSIPPTQPQNHHQPLVQPPPPLRYMDSRLTHTHTPPGRIFIIHYAYAEHMHISSTVEDICVFQNIRQLAMQKWVKHAGKKPRSQETTVHPGTTEKKENNI